MEDNLLYEKIYIIYLINTHLNASPWNAVCLVTNAVCLVTNAVCLVTNILLNWCAWALDDITEKDLVREGLGNSFVHVMCHKMQGNHVVCNVLSSGTVGLLHGGKAGFREFWRFFFFFFWVSFLFSFWGLGLWLGLGFEPWNYFAVLLGQGYHLVPTTDVCMI